MPHSDHVILEAEVLTYREIHELPGDWTPDVLRSLLADLEVEVDTVPEADLLDLAMMAVVDLDPQDAGVAVLRTVFGDRMSAGIRANLASGLGTRSLVTRLYEEGLRSDPFPEAEHILWRREVHEDMDDPRRVTVTVIRSHSFLAGLKDAQPWQAMIER